MDEFYIMNKRILARDLHVQGTGKILGTRKKPCYPKDYPKAHLQSVMGDEPGHVSKDEILKILLGPSKKFGNPLN